MRILLLLSIFCWARCQPSQPRFPAAMEAVWQAHGGLNQWKNYQALRFVIGEEAHQIDLKSRHTRITMPSGSMGFDGEQVWATDSALLEDARFYHSLYFYFFAMPFVLADPGLSYEEVPPVQLGEKSFPGIKITFADGVGDAPKDSYILCYDPSTYQMKWLMYESTFHTGEAQERYNLIEYAQWNEAGGLWVPELIRWRAWDGKQVGEITNEVIFSEVGWGEEPVQITVPKAAVW